MWSTKWINPILYVPTSITVITFPFFVSVCRVLVYLNGIETALGYQKFEDSCFLMEFGCYKVQQLHLVFTCRDIRRLKGANWQTALSLYTTNGKITVSKWTGHTSISPSIKHVVQDSTMVQVKPVSNVSQPVWATGIIQVPVKDKRNHFSIGINEPPQYMNTLITRQTKTRWM